jgi:hypothetical protein
MISSSVARRNFVKAGFGVLALPWLETFSRGAAQGSPQRLVSICTNFGLYAPAFFPEKAGVEYVPSEYLAILDELRNRYTVFSGISHPDIGGDHASEASFLTSAKRPTQPGFRNTVSMDYVAAQHVAGATRFPLVNLSTSDGSPLTCTNTGAGVPVMGLPSQVFAKMFLAGSKADLEREMARIRRGHSVLDQMRGRLGDLARTLSRQDQQQVADYAEAVRDLEKQLVAQERWMHQPKPPVSDAAPTEGYPSPFADRSDSIGRARILFQLAKLAIQTDSTRVVTVYIRGSDDKPPIPGVTEGHHGVSHHGRNPQKIEQLKIIERLKVTAFKELLVSLRDTLEAGVPLLDSTQVLFGSNLGDASGHGTTNLPILLAGGGYRHGKHIAGDVKHNTPLAKLYVSMLQRFGVETDRFGSGQGTIAELV